MATEIGSSEISYEFGSGGPKTKGEVEGGSNYFKPSKATPNAMNVHLSQNESGNKILITKFPIKQN